MLKLGPYEHVCFKHYKKFTLFLALALKLLCSRMEEAEKVQKTDKTFLIFKQSHFFCAYFPLDQSRFIVFLVLWISGALLEGVPHGVLMASALLHSILCTPRVS